MKILVLGATGPTGQHVVRQALAKGHDVTAFVRDVSKMKESHPHLRIVRGDVLREADIQQAVAGQEAVVCVLGVGNSLKSHQLMSRAVNILLPSMKKAQVRRLVFTSAMGVGETFRQASFIQKLIFRTFLKNIYADKKIADEQVKSSDLLWTILCPVKLTNGPHTGNYLTAEYIPMKGMPQISRADVADCLVKELERPEHIGKVVIVSSAKKKK